MSRISHYKVSITYCNKVNTFIVTLFGYYLGVGTEVAWGSIRGAASTGIGRPRRRLRGPSPASFTHTAPRPSPKRQDFNAACAVSHKIQIRIM